MLVDEVTIKARGGNGGQGAVTFGEDKYSHSPSGKNGGMGGSVYLEASRTTLDLSRFRYEKEFIAENGENGHRNREGRDGEDIILPVPRGTVVHNKTSGIINELTNEGDKVLVAQGGLRGRGNKEFSNARSSEPKRYEPGRDGYEAELYLELKLTADVGLVGFPNVGKSSLLNAITKSKSKVANYNFTTLEPHLGVLPDGSIMADIPGIIEGASEGKGLGIKFLRHIQRTKLLLHCIPADSADPVKDYAVIRKELAQHEASLTEKPEVVLITKTDMVTPTELKKIQTALRKKNKQILTVSILDDALLKAFTKELMEKISQHNGKI
ncbi:MAG: GTPase ObgE [Candidatus Paceibacterota bacterium]|jgi:GTP-binding protein